MATLASPGAGLGFVALTRSLSIDVSALWFGSLGYSDVYWYVFKLKAGLFFGFFLLTVAILRGCFWLLERAFASYSLEPRTVLLNNQPFNFSPARFIRPIAWLAAVLFGLFFAFAMKSSWQEFALYSHQTPTALFDPIFQSLGFLPLLASSLRSAELMARYPHLCGDVRRGGLLAANDSPKSIEGSPRKLGTNCSFNRLDYAVGFLARTGVAHVSLSISLPLGRSPNIFWRHLHGGKLPAPGAALRFSRTYHRRSYLIVECLH